MIKSKHYVWDTQSKMWNKQKHSKLIGRLLFVAPTEGERYYLRLLLASVVGPRCFLDLLTVTSTHVQHFMNLPSDVA